jgi:hypothetical protein
MRRVCFHKSDIRWLTKKEGSHGSFNVEALLRWSGDSRDTSDVKQFALGVPVLAGNMYADGELCKTPPYMFQLTASNLDHIIFRRPIAPGNQEDSDSYGSNSSIFTALEVNIESEPAKLLESYDDIERHYLCRDHLTCLLTIVMNSGSILELEFPIKHMNILPSQKRWQFETGSVLFLKESDIQNLDALELKTLLPCFIHCNRFDQADISQNYPYPKIYSSRFSRGGNRTISCKVHLLGSNRFV